MSTSVDKLTKPLGVAFRPSDEVTLTVDDFIRSEESFEPSSSGATWAFKRATGYPRAIFDQDAQKSNELSASHTYLFFDKLADIVPKELSTPTLFCYEVFDKPVSNKSSVWPLSSNYAKEISKPSSKLGLLSFFDKEPTAYKLSNALARYLIIDRFGKTPESASPFDYLDTQNTNAVIDVLGTVRGLPRKDSLEIFNRLNELFEISREELEQRVMSAQSLHFFIEFFKKHSSIRQPLIFLLDSGFIRCEWRVKRNRGLALDFMPDGSVSYFVISPNKRRRTTSVLSGDNVSWRDVIPTLDQGVDIEWLQSNAEDS